MWDVMPKNLDVLDVRILEGLAEYGPRNMVKLAEELNIPRGTMLSRIERMSSSFYLRLVTTIYHTNLGMKKAVVLIKATPGREELLFDCLKANHFYIYLSRVYGMFEGCIAIYVIPVEHTTEFQEFIGEIDRLGVGQRTELHWSTCFHTVNRTSNWFDDHAGRWVFNWQSWVKEISLAQCELPYTLRDPPSFPLKADGTDLFIVKELEKKATVGLASIARKLGTSLQNVRYHYQKHVTQNGLIETYQIAMLPFDRTIADMAFFIFKFSDMDKMTKFATTLLNKPFVIILGKILKQSSLVCQVYLPREELRNFVDALSNLARQNLLQSYEYVLQDLRQGKWSRETVPYEFFEKGAWNYEHAKHIETLQHIVADWKTNRQN